MNIPEEVRHFGECFYQGSAEDVSSNQEWIDLALRIAGRQRAPVIKRFLDELLNGRHSTAEIRRIWDTVSPNYTIREDTDLVAFLAMIRDTIAGQDREAPKVAR